MSWYSINESKKKKKWERTDTINKKSQSVTKKSQEHSPWAVGDVSSCVQFRLTKMKFSGRLIESGNFGFGDYASSRHPVVWKLSAFPTVSFLFSCEKQPLGRSKSTAFFKNLEVKTSTARVEGF